MDTLCEVLYLYMCPNEVAKSGELVHINHVLINTRNALSKLL